VEREIECFHPLLTGVNQVPTGDGAGTEAPAGGEPLPNGLGVLVRAGASLRRALLVSLALLLVSLAELAALVLYPGPEVAVVWGEESSLPLVEVP
jgi:hypothetical protein